jgi:hypothetical protein
MKIGIIMLVKYENFEFWYLGVMFLVKKILESTNLLVIALRKVIFDNFPPFIKHYVSM